MSHALSFGRRDMVMKGPKKQGRLSPHSAQANRVPGARTGIEHPGMNDVMFGRGGDTNYHIGNNSFRHLIESYSDQYWTAPNRKTKSQITAAIITGWRTQDPPGRFLAKTDPSKGDQSLWHDVGDHVAGRKASKILSEMRIGKKNKKRPNKLAAASSNDVHQKVERSQDISGWFNKLDEEQVLTNDDGSSKPPARQVSNPAPPALTKTETFVRKKAAPQPRDCTVKMWRDSSNEAIWSKRPIIESIPVAADLTDVFVDLDTVYPASYASCVSAGEEEEELCRLIGSVKESTNS